jgi:plastocyanin
MRIKIKTLGNSMYLLFSMFLLKSCSPPPQTVTVPKVYAVEIRQMKFLPSELWLQEQDSVVFINHDLVAHNVTEEYGKWASPLIEVGQSWKMAVQQHEDFFCTIHPMMKGKIRVMHHILYPKLEGNP